MEHRCPMIPCMSRKSNLLVIVCTLVPYLSIVANVYNLITIGGKLSDCIEFEDNLATEQDTKRNQTRKENKIWYLPS